MFRIAPIAVVCLALAGTFSSNEARAQDHIASLEAVHREKPASECLTRVAEDFVPKTRSERVAEAVRSVASPTPFIFTGIRASIDQEYNRPKEWGQGVRGYSLRYGSLYGEYFIGQLFQQGVSYRLHEDNQYFASGSKNVARRFAYAVSSAVLARHDNGSRSLSVSAIGGAATGAFVSRAWQPRSTTTAADAAVSFGWSLATRAGINLLREFSPRFFGRILP